MCFSIHLYVPSPLCRAAIERVDQRSVVGVSKRSEKSLGVPFGSGFPLILHEALATSRYQLQSLTHFLKLSCWIYFSIPQARSTIIMVTQPVGSRNKFGMTIKKSAMARRKTGPGAGPAGRNFFPSWFFGSFVSKELAQRQWADKYLIKTRISLLRNEAIKRLPFWGTKNL